MCPFIYNMNHCCWESITQHNEDKLGPSDLLSPPPSKPSTRKHFCGTRGCFLQSIRAPFPLDEVLGTYLLRANVTKFQAALLRLLARNALYVLTRQFQRARNVKCRLGSLCTVHTLVQLAPVRVIPSLQMYLGNTGDTKRTDESSALTLTKPNKV